MTKAVSILVCGGRDFNNISFLKLNYNSWQLPEIFQKIMLAGEIPQEEMINVFNLGIGYCIVTSPNNEENIHNIIEDLGFRSWTIGEVVL